jgi:hypothetical protein
MPPKAKVNLEHWQLRYGIANKISRGTFSATFLLASRLTLTWCGYAGAPLCDDREEVKNV